MVAGVLALLWFALGAHPADGPDVDVRILIGRDKVTFAILMNLAFIDEVVDTPREDDTALHPEEYQPHRLDLRDHFAATNRVTIDGVQVEPVDVAFEAGEPDLSLLPLFPRMGAKALIKVRLVLEYPAKAPPSQVSAVWGVFPDDLALETEMGTPPMQVVAQLTARGLRSRVVFTVDEPQYTWHDTGESLVDRFEAVPETGPREDPLEVPLLSAGLLLFGGAGAGLALRRRRRWPWLLLVVPGLCFGAWASTDVARVEFADPFAEGARLPTEAEALAAFHPLHANIYRAFDYVDESDIYDALERSVHGELLDTLYQRVYRSLIMQEEGGAVSEVQEVRPQETAVESIGLLPPDDTPGFTVNARWQVDGSVFHWGHSHSRTNEYQARYTVVQTDSGWRIHGQQILEQILVSTSTTDPRGR